jgi:monofunctional glycosyltransferase
MRAFFRWTAAVIGVLLGIIFVWQAYYATMLWWWQDHNPGTTAFMSARLARMQEQKPDAKLKQMWVPYNRISNNLKRAVLAAEDDKFADHDGFDWDGIKKAIEKNEKRGKVVAGGSTISQQLAKNLFLSGERSVIRKGQEATITVMMEHIMDKERILEIYLNVIEWGDGVYGAEAAARHYYGISAAQLSTAQAAKLAAMVPRPRFYDRNRNAPYLLHRAEIIQARMQNAQLP